MKAPERSAVERFVAGGHEARDIAALADWLMEHPEELHAALSELINGRVSPPQELDPRFARTEFVVAANDYERLSLWRENDRRSPGEGRVPWDEDTQGVWYTVGHLAGRPVNVSFVWARLNGHLVVFYEPISQVVAADLVDAWLRKHCNPKYDSGTRLANTNAMNFHLCLDHCRETP